MIAFVSHWRKLPGTRSFRQATSFSVGNPAELTVRDLVDRIVEATGSRSAVIHLPLPTDDPRRRRPDIGRAQRLLEWRPEVSLAAGLRATITWFKTEMTQAASDPSLAA